MQQRDVRRTRPESSVSLTGGSGPRGSNDQGFPQVRRDHPEFIAPSFDSVQRLFRRHVPSGPHPAIGRTPGSEPTATEVFPLRLEAGPAIQRQDRSAVHRQGNLRL